MLALSRIGNNHPPIQGQETHLMIRLQAVIAAIVIGQGGRPIRGSRIQPLVAFLGLACRTKSSVLLHLRPQRFVGSPDLAGDIAGHLSGQPILQAYLIVAITLQGALITHLAVRETVLAHSVQGIAVRQLRLSQGLELGRGKFLFVLVLSCLVQKHYLWSYENAIAVGECKLINTLSLIDESIEAFRILNQPRSVLPTNLGMQT